MHHHGHAVSQHTAFAVDVGHTRPMRHNEGYHHCNICDVFVRSAHRHLKRHHNGDKRVQISKVPTITISSPSALGRSILMGLKQSGPLTRTAKEG